MKSHANTTQSRLGALISTASLTLPLASQAARNAVLPSLDQTLVTITAQATNCVLPESPASPFRGAFEVTFQSTYGLADLAALKNQLTDPGVGLYFDSPVVEGATIPCAGSFTLRNGTNSASYAMKTSSILILPEEIQMAFMASGPSSSTWDPLGLGQSGTASDGLGYTAHFPSGVVQGFGATNVVRLRENSSAETYLGAQFPLTINVSNSAPTNEAPRLTPSYDRQNHRLTVSFPADSSSQFGLFSSTNVLSGPWTQVPEGKLSLSADGQTYSYTVPTTVSPVSPQGTVLPPVPPPAQQYLSLRPLVGKQQVEPTVSGPTN